MDAVTYPQETGKMLGLPDSDMSENRFRKELIDSLNSRGIPAKNQYMNTFDVLVSDGFIEIKKLKWNPRYRRPTIEFTVSQTEEMRCGRLPYVVVFGEKPERYYLMNHEELAKKVFSKSRENYPVIWITEDRLEVPALVCYEALLEALSEVLRVRTYR
jgi:hypothetical protein